MLLTKTYVIIVNGYCETSRTSDYDLNLVSSCAIAACSHMLLHVLLAEFLSDHF